MSKLIKSKDETIRISEQFLKHGWEQDYNSATSTVYTSIVPSVIKNNMIEAYKEKRVLSTGTVLGFLSRDNGDKVTEPQKDKKNR